MLLKKVIKKFIGKKDPFQQVISQFLKKYAKTSATSPTVIIWELGGFASILEKNAIYSVALNVRGFKTHFIICDGTSPACMQREMPDDCDSTQWEKRCQGCVSQMVHAAEKNQVPYSFVGAYVHASVQQQLALLSEGIALSDILTYRYCDIPVGEFAWSSVNRFMKGALISVKEVDGFAQQMYRKYFYAALFNAAAAFKIIEKHKPAALFTSHGVYVDYGPAVAVFAKKNIPVTTWTSGFNDFFHYFTVPKTFDVLEIRGIRDDDWQKRKEKPLNNFEERMLDNFIEKRYFQNTSRDVNFLQHANNLDAIKQELGLSVSKPTVCLFTHLNWDACFDVSKMLFESANQWVIESIKHMINVPHVNWLIKVHPSGIVDGAVLATDDDLISAAFPTLPDHIKIVSSQTKISAYTMYQMIDVGITMFGTVGAELPLFGKPIIAASNAHFGEKGFSYDPKTKEEYFSLLENIQSIKPLTKAQIQLARQYAYSYFIQRHIPLNAIDKKKGHWGGLDITRLHDLLPGNDPVMDKICDSIINGTDVILPQGLVEKVDQEYRR